MNVGELFLLSKKRNEYETFVYLSTLYVQEFVWKMRAFFRGGPKHANDADGADDAGDADM